MSATIIKGTRVLVSIDRVNAYQVWKGAPLVLKPVTGTVVSLIPAILVNLDAPLPMGTEGAAVVVRRTVTATRKQLTVM